MKDFLKEVRDSIKEDARSAWRDIRGFAMNHPYVTVVAGTYAITGAYYSALFDWIKRKGLDFQIVRKV